MVVHSAAVAEMSSNRAVMIVLAYLWPLAIVPLLVQRDDADVQWHAKHGLVLMVAELVLLLAFTMVTSVLSLSLATVGIGCVLSVFVFFVWLAFLALHA